MLQDKSVGFIGFGEVASVYGRLLTEKGWRVFVYDYRFNEGSERGDKKRRKAKTLGLVPTSALIDLAKGVSCIFSTVTPSSALQVARELAQILGEGHLLFDLNSTNPLIKQQSFQLFRTNGSVYLDGAIMASPVHSGLSTPIYYSGGLDPGEIAALAAVMNIRKVGAEIGQASAIKMSQSIITKGLQMLILEQVMLSSKWGIQTYVTDNMDQLFDDKSYSYWFNYTLTTNVLHARRRADEMRMVVELLNDSGLNAGMSEATCRMLNWLADRRLNDDFNDDSDIAALEVLKRLMGRVKDDHN